MGDIPTKYEVIPIHASDVNAFLSCRRRWDWTSPARNNLRRRVDINGVNPNLWFGSGIHYALEMYYHPSLRRDPTESFKTWYKYQWEGGEVTEEWLERLSEINPIQLKNGNYTVRGLQDMMPDPDQEEFGALYDLGIGMMEFYKEYAAREDDFTVIKPEMMFSVSLGFESIDTREQSPNYGKKLEVHARGMRDAIIEYTNGHHGIIDHKTAAKVDEDYFAKLETDPQCSTYIWATNEEGDYEVDSVLYNVMRKNYPKPPTPLKNGTPSLNRTEEGTTAGLFESYIRDNGLVEWFEANEKAQNYFVWLYEIGDKNFVERKLTYRSKTEIKNIGLQLRQIAEDMLDPNLKLYPHFTGDYNCTRCAFRVPCIAMQDGSDWSDIINDGYERNRGR